MHYQEIFLANLAATEEVVAVTVMVVGTMTMYTEHLLHACQVLWQTLNHCHLIQRSTPAKGEHGHCANELGKHQHPHQQQHPLKHRESGPWDPSLLSLRVF